MTFACPALRSDDTLGFLAALGVLELCTSALGHPARLGWEGVGGAAFLDVPVDGVEKLASELQDLALRFQRAGRVLPCDDPGPVAAPLSDAERKARRASGEAVRLDPAKLPQRDAVDVFARMRRVEVSGPDQDSARWLAGLVNQLRIVQGFCALTPLYSPSGQMTLYQLYRDHLEEVCKNPQLLREALVGWRRRPGTGANLDSRALRDAVTSSTGKAENAAVTGASWLGLMAVPFFRLVWGGQPAIGWYRDQRRLGPTLRWPVWTMLLDRPAVDVLLSHPGLAKPDEERLRVLGVQAICTSRRRALDNSAGALMPASVRSIG